MIPPIILRKTAAASETTEIKPVETSGTSQESHPSDNNLIADTPEERARMFGESFQAQYPEMAGLAIQRDPQQREFASDDMIARGTHNLRHNVRQQRMEEGSKDFERNQSQPNVEDYSSAQQEADYNRWIRPYLGQRALVRRPLLSDEEPADEHTESVHTQTLKIGFDTPTSSREPSVRPITLDLPEKTPVLEGRHMPSAPTRTTLPQREALSTSTPEKTYVSDTVMGSSNQTDREIIVTQENRLDRLTATLKEHWRNIDELETFLGLNKSGSSNESLHAKGRDRSPISPRTSAPGEPLSPLHVQIQRSPEQVPRDAFAGAAGEMLQDMHPHKPIDVISKMSTPSDVHPFDKHTGKRWVDRGDDWFMNPADVAGMSRKSRPAVRLSPIIPIRDQSRTGERDDTEPVDFSFSPNTRKEILKMSDRFEPPRSVVLKPISPITLPISRELDLGPKEPLGEERYGPGYNEYQPIEAEKRRRSPTPVRPRGIHEGGEMDHEYDDPMDFQRKTRRESPDERPYYSHVMKEDRFKIPPFRKKSRKTAGMTQVPMFSNASRAPDRNQPPFTIPQSRPQPQPQPHVIAPPPKSQPQFQPRSAFVPPPQVPLVTQLPGYTPGINTTPQVAPHVVNAHVAGQPTSRI